MITCDSALDLSPDLVKEYNIRVLPMIVRMGSSEYLDIEEATPDDILAYHDKTDDLAVTMPPTVEQTARFFTRLVHMGYTVIHFSLSSTLSKAYENAVTAAGTFPKKVTVIDSKTASVAGGLVLIAAAEMLRAGKSSLEIIQESKSIISRLRGPFLLDDMEFLYKGGRASTVSTVLAGLFNIKPSLYIDPTDGIMKAGKRFRGKFQNCTPKFIQEYVTEAADSMDKNHFMIGHTGLEHGFLQDCKTEIERISGCKNIHIVRAGCTITSHLGKNVLVLCWYTKK